MDSIPRPRLPWEVIETAIDYSRGHSKTLRSLALTCHQLLPRTRLAMFARIRFKDREHLFAFVDFLQENPHLMPVVCSIVVRPADLAPVPLLSILSSLSEIIFSRDLSQDTADFPTLHPSSVTCFRLLGTHIRTLHLSSHSFDKLVSFARAILAFPNLTHLACDRVKILEKAQSIEEPPTLSEIIKRQLSRRMKLEALTVNCDYLIVDHQATNLGRLLLDSSSSIPLTVESLTLRWGVRHEFLNIYQCNWSSLRSLTLQLSEEESRRTKNSLGDREIIRFLRGFPKCTSLTDITLEWRPRTIDDLCNDLLSRKKTYKKLDHTLLTFSQPRIICAFTCPLSTNGGSFWLRELRKHLPVLSQRGAVTLHSQCDDVLGAGHDGPVLALDVSMDGDWVASGSIDSTIILWDANNGTITQRWVAHDYNEVRTVAFSPDSQYLVSGGRDNQAAIWDIGRGAHKVTTLDGHSDQHFWRCSWSPDGGTIVTGSMDGTVQLWDGRTFQQRALYQLRGQIDCLAFSPNARWLVCRSTKPECSVLNVASGTLHRSLGIDCSDRYSLPPPRRPYNLSISAAFDPTSTRLAISSKGQPPGIDVIDVETGKTFFHWKGKEGTWEGHMKNISFSPDGRLVLSVASDNCYILDAFTGTELFHLQGPRSKIKIAKFSPCGKYIASGSGDGTTQLWGTNDGSFLMTVSEHARVVWHIAFSPDGKTLSSAGDDGRVIIRCMCDIIPAIDSTQDDHPLIAPSPPSIVQTCPHSTPLSDDRSGHSSDEETDPEELRPIAKCGEADGLEMHVEGYAAYFGRLRLRQPLACSSSRDSTTPEAEPNAGDDDLSANPNVRSSAAAREVVVEDLPTRAVRPWLPAAAEHEASTSGGWPPSREVQKDADSADQAEATPTVEGNVTCSDNAIAGDERAVEARHWSSTTTSSARLSSQTPAEREALTGRGQLPSREVQEDANGAGQAQATPVAELENADLAASSTPPMDRATNEQGGRGVVNLRAADSGWGRESVAKTLKAISRNVGRTARQVASDAKKCCEKLTMFGARAVPRRGELPASASMS